MSSDNTETRLTRMPHDRSWAIRAAALAVADALGIVVAYALALFLRFDFIWAHVPPECIDGLTRLLPIYIPLFFLIMWCFRLYHSIWRFASVTELARLMCAWGCEQVGVWLIALITQTHMPVSFYFVGAVLTLCFTAADRFTYRFLRGLKNLFASRRATGKGEQRVMVVGAGEAGRQLVREMLTSRVLEMTPVCAIDDNPSKPGRYLESVPIVGGRDQIASAAKQYGIDLIAFAIPSATGHDRREILDICRKTADEQGCEIRVIPGTYQLLDGQATLSALRPVNIEDLLGRDPVRVNLDEVRGSLRDKTVLVTGGGGSIGSELCRQIAQAAPRRLIIFDIYENNAYAIQQELRTSTPGLHLETLIGSVRDTGRLREVFAQYRPDIVFHAAAHKHVPLMEDSPHEAIKNNVLGTYNVARIAMEAGTRRFVLISTDKAVNPTNVMGASKRICEMVVQAMDRRSAKRAAETGAPRTEYTAVRFGNVLGSNGSVIPLFEKQIAHGGPVTVTDSRVVRYFMTIPEAVSLVLQASYYAHGGEIFVLDMGEPVKIDDMARNLIRLTGHEPDVDIKIVYTGLRPGEKLYEERLMSEEGLRKTANKLISVAEPIEMDDEVFEEQLDALSHAAYDEEGDIRAAIADIVPTFHPERGGAEANDAVSDAHAARLMAEKQDAALRKEEA